jgi:branched-chain amino acid transport system substrate-binding protein
VPQVLANTGHRDFGDPTLVKKYPWTQAWLPPYELESFAITGYLKERKPQASVAILHTNDDLGKSLFEGFKKATEGSRIKIAAVQIYNPSDASVASPTQALAQSGADVFLNWSGGTFTTQSISKMAELGWKPTTFLISWNTALSTLQPAGLQNSRGFLAPGYLKSPTDPTWAQDAGMKQYREIVAKYAPNVDANQQLVAYGFTEAEIFVTALKKAPRLTRAALMSSLRNMKGEKMTMLVPGITISTSDAQPQYWPITALSMREFDGDMWKDTGKVYSMP